MPHTDNVWKVLSKGCLLELWLFLWTKQSLLRSLKVMNNNDMSRILKGVQNWTSTGQRFCWVIMLKREVRRRFSYCPILGSLACLCSTWIHSVSLGASSDSLLVPSPGVSTWRSPPWSTWLTVWAGSNNTGPTPYVYRLLAVCQAQFQVLLHVIWFSPHHDQVPLRFSIYRWGKWSKGHAACNRPSLDLNLGGPTLEPLSLNPYNVLG